MTRTTLTRATFFLAGVGAAACFVGPLTGFVGALFWPHILGGSTEGSAAKRIVEGEYWRSYQSGDYPSLAGSPDVTNCQWKLLRKQKQADMSLTAGDLTFVLDSEQMERRNRVREEPTLNALAALPYPALGALEGCLQRSVLARFCRRYINNVKDISVKAAARDIDIRKATIDRQVEAMRCYAAE